MLYCRSENHSSNLQHSVLHFLCVYTYLRQNQDTYFQEGICLHRSPDQEGRSSQLYTHCRVIHQAGIPLDTHYHHHTQTHTHCSTDSGSSQMDISDQLHVWRSQTLHTLYIRTYTYIDTSGIGTGGGGGGGGWSPLP